MRKLHGTTSLVRVPPSTPRLLVLPLLPSIVSGGIEPQGLSVPLLRSISESVKLMLISHEIPALA